jgi:hypothetical protein
MLLLLCCLAHCCRRAAQAEGLIAAASALHRSHKTVFDCCALAYVIPCVCSHMTEHAQQPQQHYRMRSGTTTDTHLALLCCCAALWFPEGVLAWDQTMQPWLKE